jgi:NADP-dependent 3-hydroxy acid dehydrogenase YdfG
MVRRTQRNRQEAHVRDIRGKIAWVTGAGTGIGEAAAKALAAEGAIVVLTGRRREPLDKVAAVIKQAGGKASVQSGDLGKAATVDRIVSAIVAEHGRLDIVVSNAGTNVPNRWWRNLTTEAIDTLVAGNLQSALYVTHAVLPVMRAQKEGQLIHTSSMAGRNIGMVSGPIYTAAKHGVVAMSHTVNVEECLNGIRSSVILPGEVATEIMQFRDPPELPETLAKMVQPEDMGAVVVFVAKQPQYVNINEMWVTPTHNRGYIAMVQGRKAQWDEARAKGGKG